MPTSIRKDVLVRYRKKKHETAPEIPPEVRVIGSGAFENTDFEEIIIPDTVTEIRAEAFLNCKCLRKLVIPDTVTFIGDGAFAGCFHLTGITIPASVTHIGINIFRDCDNLGTINVDEKNTDYDSRNNCNAVIESATNTLIAGCMNTLIPPTVTAIGDWAFCDCHLSKIFIPPAVKHIAGNAFASCLFLEQIIVDINNRWYNCACLCNAVIETATNTLVCGCRKTVIPDTVTAIGEYAFFSLGIRSIKIPRSVRSIGRYAFAENYRFGSIRLPSSVREIGEGAFARCALGEETVLPEGVETIGKYAFMYSDSESFVIPSSVRKIGDGVFNRCCNLKNIYLESGNPILFNRYEYRNLAIDTFINNRKRFTEEAAKNFLPHIMSRKDRYLPLIFENDDVELLAMLADGGLLRTADINAEFVKPATEAGAVQCTAYLLSWKNSNRDPEAEEKALEKELNGDPFSVTAMRKIWSYDVKEDDTVIINFYKGRETSVSVPPRIGKRKVTEIGPGAFSPRRERMKQALKQKLEAVISVTIPDTVTEIGEYAFFGSNCTTVILPDSVTEIKNETFKYCSKLSFIRFPAGLKRIKMEAFSDCFSDSVGEIVIPESVTSIEDCAFYSCNAKGIRLNARICEINKNLFSSCRYLEWVTLPDTVMEIKDYAFAYCTALKEINIPSSVIRIDRNSFHYCRNVKKITVDKDNLFFDSRLGCNAIIKKIDNTLILGCSSTVIPDTVSIIGYYAFDDCSGIKAVTIPVSVKEIQSYAFNGSALEEITYLSPYTETSGYAFGYRCGNVKIKCLPDSEAHKFAINNRLPFELFKKEG